MITANNTVIMADITTIIAELKSQLASNGIYRFHKTIKTPGNVMVCCPFHKDGQEKKPSLGILEKDGTCHCFACGWVGSIQEMISLCFGKNDMGAFGSKWLIKNFVSAEVSERPALDLNFDRHKNIPHQQYVTEAELDAYRYTHAYLYKRKMTDEIIEMFDLGYDKKTNSITFPVRDVNGNTLFVARRNVDRKFYNYPAGVEKPLYGLYEVTKVWEHEPYQVNVTEMGVQRNLYNIPEVIVCEGMFDALTCWVYGKFAVALNGLGNDLQFEQLRRLPCRKLILATDMDEAGLDARERIKKNVPNKIIYEYKWDLNVAKDINDMTEDYFNSLTPLM